MKNIIGDITDIFGDDTLIIEKRKQIKLSKVHSLIHQLRTWMTKPEFDTFFLKDGETRMQFYSALDVIEDCDLAIEYYKKKDFPLDFSGKYLYIYGLLQALFLQQDAVRHAAFGLNITINFAKDKKYSKLLKIRHIRNSTIGHPTNNGGEYNFIVRTSITQNSFQLNYYLKGSELKVKQINTKKLISDQVSCICAIINNMLAAMQNRKVELMKKYDIKLLGNFNSVEYFFQRMRRIQDKQLEDNWTDFRISLKQIISIHNNIKHSIENLYEKYDSYNNIGYVFDEIKKLFTILEKTNSTEDDLEIRRILCYIESLEELFKELQDICEDIDKEYSTKNKLH